MPTPDSSRENIDSLIDHLFRQEYGKMVAYLTKMFGMHQLMAMEDVAQETLLDAHRHWSYHGIPEAPSHWLFKAAKNKAINLYWKEKRQGLARQQIEIETATEASEVYLEEEISDSLLRMIFAVSSLNLSHIDRTLLVLNVLCGFSRKEIASAVLMKEEAVKKRLFRAKKAIRQEGVSLEVPAGTKLKNSLHEVLISLYLLFNEGYNSSSANELIRRDICLEAIRLTKLMISHFPEVTATKALLALMCFHAARFESRIDDKGAIVLIDHQDRGKWDADLISMGMVYLSEASSGDFLSSFHLEAAIAAEHCKAKNFDDTDWEQILKYYQTLNKIKPSPVIAMNMAIVNGICKDIKMGIQQLLDLEKSSQRIAEYHLLHASIGEFYRRIGEWQLAIERFQKAKEFTRSQKENQLLDDRIATCRKKIK